MSKPKPRIINIQITYRTPFELKEFLALIKKQSEEGFEEVEIYNPDGTHIRSLMYYSEPRIGREEVIDGKRYMIYKSHIDYLTD
jgi:hypothetical protein